MGEKSGSEYDIVVVGGGTAGLVTAAGAATLGARVALVERHRLGGECLWTGCVPSKAMIGSARVARTMARADAFGLEPHTPDVDGARVLASVREARGVVRHHDDPERFRRMGVEVLEGVEAHLTSRGEVRAGDRVLRGRKIVLATGSRPAVPPISGLEETGYFTHETAFDREAPPKSVVILGAGAIGVEFAQAYISLGVDVTLVEMEERILPQEDPDLTARLQRVLREQGVHVLTCARASAAMPEMEGRCVLVEAHGHDVRGLDDCASSPRDLDLAPGERVESTRPGILVGRDEKGRWMLRADEILVATGRRPNVESLELEAAGVEVSAGGIVVDGKLRTSRRGIFAAGDVTGGAMFTHVADHEARTVVRNALFPLASRVDYSVVPWAVYSEPELARVGLTEAEARERHGDDVGVFTCDMADLDRAITDRETEGMVKLVTDGRGRLLGGHLLAPSAGSLVVEVALALRGGLRITDLADLIHPYPTLSEGIRRAAGEYYRSMLTDSRRRLLERWFGFARTLGL